MAAWPNAMFDLCGICCGHFQMPFLTFFGGTLLGKAFTLRPVQSFVLVAIFSDVHRAKILASVASLFSLFDNLIGGLSVAARIDVSYVFF